MERSAINAGLFQPLELERNPDPHPNPSPEGRGAKRRGGPTFGLGSRPNDQRWASQSWIALGTSRCARPET